MQIYNFGECWHDSPHDYVPRLDLGRNVIFMIDNLAVMFGWYNGYVKMTSQLWKYW